MNRGHAVTAVAFRALVLLAAASMVACDKEKATVTVTILPRDASSAQANLATASEVIVRRVNSAGGSAKASKDASKVTIRVRDLSLEQTAELATRRGALYLAELKVDASRMVTVRKPDGSTTLLPLPQVLTSPDLIESAEFVAVTVPDLSGVERQISGLYFRDAFVSKNIAGLTTVTFEMTDEGAHLLQTATARLSNPPMPVTFVLDGVPMRGANGGILAPLVYSAITTTGVITGLTQEDAKVLAVIIGSGEIPSSVEVS